MKPQTRRPNPRGRGLNQRDAQGAGLPAEHLLSSAVCWEQLWAEGQRSRAEVRKFLFKELIACGEESSPPILSESISLEITVALPLGPLPPSPARGQACRESDRDPWYPWALGLAHSGGADSQSCLGMALPAIASPTRRARLPERGLLASSVPTQGAEPRARRTPFRLSKHQAASHLPFAPNPVCPGWAKLRTVPLHSRGHRTSFSKSWDVKM